MDRALACALSHVRDAAPDQVMDPLRDTGRAPRRLLKPARAMQGVTNAMFAWLLGAVAIVVFALALWQFRPF